MEHLIKEGSRILREEGIRPFLHSSGAFVWSSLHMSERIPQRVFSVYLTGAEWWYLNRKEFDTDQWDAPLNPYKLVWISPNKITKMTSRRPNLPIEQRIEQFGVVKGGDWDISSDMSYTSWRPDKYGDNKWIYEHIIARDFEETTFFKSAQRHFDAGIPWEETVFFQRMVEGFDQGKAGWPDWGRDETELIETLQNIDELYESVANEGMQTVQELENKSFFRTINSSILVDISRDGEFLFVEGRRRLTVAKILNLDTIPVRIQIRHEDWMDHRDRIYNNNIVETHPDFIEFDK